ncbi:MAG: PHP domain-containing protein [Candidatus Aenigmatarchaeota archaeon]
MLAELHCHTTYSVGTKVLLEGLNSPKQMLMRAKNIGLNALAITDHNEIKGALEAKKLEKKYGLTVIVGEEISTIQGHLLALGIRERIEKKLDLQETLDLIHEQGGVAVASHPFDIQRKGLGELARKCDAVEAFNALNVERIANYNNKKLAKRYGMPITAGSDAHCVEMLGYGITDIDAYDEASAIKAIRNGRTVILGTYIPTNAIMEWYVTRLKLSYVYVINYMNENYSWPKRTVARNLLRLVNRHPGKIDYLFKMFAYMSFFSVVTYSASRQLLGIK